MPTDLIERLAAYRTTLDGAIAADLADRTTSTHPPRARSTRLLLAGAAIGVVAMGVIALAWSATDRGRAPATTPSVDPPEMTVDESVASVAPEPTSAPADTTAAQPDAATAIDRLALGDSVMLGAAADLAERGFTVDAVESRAFVNGVEVIEALAAREQLGDLVVVHLGTNGPISSTDMTRLMDALADVPRVVLLTLDIPRDYIAANNALLYDTASTYPNVELLDWAGLADACPGTPPASVPPASTQRAGCFYDDGFHLRPDGQRYYANLIDSMLPTVGD